MKQILMQALRLAAQAVDFRVFLFPSGILFWMMNCIMREFSGAKQEIAAAGGSTHETDEI